MSGDLAAPPVYSPCAKKWEFMHQVGLRRQFCDRCQLPVHNLSALSKREADVFVAQAKGRRTCFTYQMRRDGSLITRSVQDVVRWRWRRLKRGILATARVGILGRYLRRTPGGDLSARPIDYKLVSSCKRLFSA